MITRIAKKIAEIVADLISEFLAPIHTKLDKLEKKECIACGNWKSHVDYLQDQVTILQKERKSERDEYKRTVDRLIEALGAKPVGQGPTPAPEKPVTLDLGTLFEEQEEPVETR